MTAIEPSAIRYIKLGEQSRWAATAIERGELHFGYQAIPHDLCLRGDWNAVVAQVMSTDGKKSREAKNAMREIRDFYTLDAKCLWITIFNKTLYWTFAEPAVIWNGPETTSQGARIRRSIGGWRGTSIGERPLRTDQLSTKLTQLAAYRMTICQVAESDYLLRRLIDVEEPILVAAQDVQQRVIEVASTMIRNLHWADFETMIDLIFSRGGWQRVSVLGDTAADVDLELFHPTTSERAFVQVKSRAGQAVLDDYEARYRASRRFQRMFFVCHTPKGRVENISPDVHVWLGTKLAEMAVSTGLFSWLMERNR